MILETYVSIYRASTLNTTFFSILLGRERFFRVYITAKMGKEPNYTDEDSAKIKLQVEQRKKTTEILKVFLSGFFFFCTGDVGAG